MINFLLILYVGCALAALALGIRHTLHIFQLNSYQYQGEGRYLRTHRLYFFLPLAGLILGIYPLSLRFRSSFSLGEALVLAVLGILFLAALCALYFPRKAKKKLVFTPRVKRLLLTTLLLALIVGILAFSLSEGWVWGLYSCGMLLASLSSHLVLLAGLCNRPLEREINRYYIRDARRLLRSCPDLKVIGITGSYGKTSVKYYLHTLLEAGFDVLMTPESFNTPMGIVKTIRGSLRATHQIFLCEMGARHVGDIREICDIVEPDMGVITSLGCQHLETFKTLDNIVGTKRELFDALKEGSPRFVNGDNEIVRRYGLDQGAVTYGFGENNAYRAGGLSYSEKGAGFWVQAPDGTRAEFHTKLLGEHSVVNLTGAIAVAHSLGIPLEKLKIPVRRLEGAPHRLQPISRGDMTVIDDAYNSNPNGAKVALETLGMFDGLKILVTPGMVELGEEEDRANFELGVQAARHCDYIVLVGRGHSQTQSIQRGVESTDFPRERLYAAENLQDAMEYVGRISTDRKKVVLLENDLPDNYL